MDGKLNQKPNFSVPEQGSEATPQLLPEQAQPLFGPERQPRPETKTDANPASSATSQVAMPVLPTDPTAQPIHMTQDNPQLIVPTGAIADHGDLISKEWMWRIKNVIYQNRDDPRKQSEEFNKLKAEYIKDRYNLTIKSS